MKLFVYQGPSEGFSEYVKKLIPGDTDNDEIIQFSAISDEISFNQRSMEVYPSGQTPLENVTAKSYLVCNKDDYSTITSAGINRFLGLSSKYSFKNIILHNPPKQLEEKIVSRHQIKKEDYKHKTFSYANISEKNITDLKSNLENNILGQNSAIQEILASLFMALSTPNKNSSPLVIMFYGSSGSGKTETSKIISKVLDGDGNLFRKQLSMYQNNHSANYLFGGEHSEESLARDLMQRSSNVILFDEFDKLHQSLFSVFYQLFDEGLFEDNNYTVKMSKSIIICTSNFESEDEIKESLGEPIFSRFDACIKFDPLDADSTIEVAEKIYSNYYSELSESQKIIVDIARDDTHQFIRTIAPRIKNVRIIDRYIRQRISSILLNDLICNSQNNS